jgi:DNA transformation protein
VPESRGFVEFAVDLLSLVGPVRARAMFGGHGIYCGGVMIGLVDDDEVFLKTDAETLPRFVAAGCRRWVYAGGGRTMETSYFRPPDEAHEDAEAMLPWGRLALEAARRGAAAKASRRGMAKRGRPEPGGGKQSSRAKGGGRARRPGTGRR